MKSWNAALTVSLSLVASSLPALAQQRPRLVAEEAMVPSGDAGIDIFVRNKHLAEMTGGSPGRTLIFVHGATYPASTSFDCCATC